MPYSIVYMRIIARDYDIELFSLNVYIFMMYRYSYKLSQYTLLNCIDKMEMTITCTMYIKYCMPFNAIY